MRCTALAAAFFVFGCSSSEVPTARSNQTARSPEVAVPSPTANASRPAASATVVPVESASANPSGAPPREERAVAKSGRAAFTRGGSLWITDEKGQNAQPLIERGKVAIENKPDMIPAAFEMSGLAFSPDDSRVYFEVPGWATSMALFYVEVRTKKVFFFHDANGYRVIEACKDPKQIGRIITFEHSYFDVNPSSAVDMFFLVDSAEPKRQEERTGKSGRIGIVGPTEKNVERFMAKKCGQGKAPPHETPPVPAKFTAPTVKCGNVSVKHADLDYLDGTRELRFTPTDKDGAGMILSLEDLKTICAESNAGH
jgi:hypothetical protein